MLAAILSSLARIPFKIHHLIIPRGLAQARILRLRFQQSLSVKLAGQKVLAFETLPSPDGNA